MKKSIAVLGLGKFGMSLVKPLDKYGADVLAADKEEDFVNEIADYCTAAVCADLSIEENLVKLGLKDMDIVVVAMGESLEPSILAVAVAKEAGVPVRIIHSHSTGNQQEIKRRMSLFHRLSEIHNRKVLDLYATHMFACSEAAG